MAPSRSSPTGTKPRLGGGGQDDSSAGTKAVSLVVVDVQYALGFVPSRIPEKVGQRNADAAELFFDGVRVPRSNILGARPGRGFGPAAASES